MEAERAGASIREVIESWDDYMGDECTMIRELADRVSDPNLGQQVVSVLVLDDDPAMQSAIELMLSRCAVASAQTIREANDLLDRSDWSLILVDIRLRDGDGRDWVKRLPAALKARTRTMSAWERADLDKLELSRLKLEALLDELGPGHSSVLTPA